MIRYIEDSELAKRNITAVIVGGTGANYNAVVSHTATPVTVPIVEPVSLTDVKDYSHVDLGDDDSKINSLIPMARGMVERYTGLSLIPVTIVSKVINGLGNVQLLAGPSTNVKDTNGDDVDLMERFDEQELNYDGGYAKVDVPSALHTAMLMIIDNILNGENGISNDIKELLKPFQYA